MPDLPFRGLGIFLHLNGELLALLQITFSFDLIQSRDRYQFRLAEFAAGIHAASRMRGYMKFFAGCHVIAVGERGSVQSSNQRSEEHTSELQSRFGISYAVF